MEMKPMRRSKEAELARSKDRRKSTGPRIVPLSRGEKGTMITLTAILAAVFLFYFAAGLSPLVTGRCLRCVLTGNDECSWLQKTGHTHKRRATAVAPSRLAR